MTDKIIILWLRQDLRLKDNPALVAASSYPILPIYINDTTATYQTGSASRWWLHHSLKKLQDSLKGNLSFYQGDPQEVLLNLLQRFSVQGVYWNRCYEPFQIDRDKKIKTSLKMKGLDIKSFNGSLLFEPWDVLKNDGSPYKVFTPFYKNGCLSRPAPRKPLDVPQGLNLLKDKESFLLEKFDFLPHHAWSKKLENHWEIGEEAAQKRLYDFIDHDLRHYKKGRDFPAQKTTSRLSPYLHFGEVSPNQVWYAAQTQKPDDNLIHFLSELGWREFSYYLLYHFPHLPHQNFNSKFDAFPWIEAPSFLEKWQKGKTGYPIVDAGMRELWQTGSMHNRVRMIVGSFLVKNLRLHWRQGASWFWDCLVDADCANNSAGWQWVAGSGADASPYFRIFNPVTQGQKFDPEGSYTYHHVPELKNLPIRYLFNPWEAPQDVLEKAGVILGKTYPFPLVNLQQSRKEALEAFKTLSSQISGSTPNFPQGIQHRCP
jgi:deoxyribodipyrimidine photo-lyase